MSRCRREQGGGFLKGAGFSRARRSQKPTTRTELPIFARRRRPSPGGGAKPPSSRGGPRCGARSCTPHRPEVWPRNRNLRHTTVVLDDVAATAGERPVATPPSSCMGAAEVDPLLPARRVCGSTPSSYATPSSEYVQTVATRVVYSRGYGAFYVSLLAASITELVWIFHPWRNHCCRSHTRPPCVRARRLQSMSSAHDPPFGCAPGSPTRRRLSSLSSSRTSH